MTIEPPVLGDAQVLFLHLLLGPSDERLVEQEREAPGECIVVAMEPLELLGRFQERDDDVDVQAVHLSGFATVDGHAHHAHEHGECRQRIAAGSLVERPAQLQGCADKLALELKLAHIRDLAVQHRKALTWVHQGHTFTVAWPFTSDYL